MIKSPETLVAHPCEKFHEGLISVPDPVPTGRVGHVVESAPRKGQGHREHPRHQARPPLTSRNARHLNTRQ
jgi:hypothetical protein